MPDTREKLSCRGYDLSTFLSALRLFVIFKILIFEILPFNEFCIGVRFQGILNDFRGILFETIFKVSLTPHFHFDPFLKRGSVEHVGSEIKHTKQHTKEDFALQNY